jgi:1,2-phenylacetyl-CoA epoxidase catalytic subunit
VAGLAAKIDREEAYHRMHAEMWAERVRGEPRYRAALDELWPAALALVEPDLRPTLAERFAREIPSNTVLQAFERGQHVDDWEPLWQEMTMVRRSIPGAAW